MQVILKKDIPGIGRMGELVKVKSGYARNYLIPHALVIAANSQNLKVLEHQKRIVEFQKKKVRAESEEVAKKLAGIEIKAQRRFNEAGKMFGSMNSQDLSQELSSKGHQVDRRDIEIETVRAPGEYNFKVRLAGDVFVDLKLILEAVQEKPAKSAKGDAKKTKAAGEKKKTAKTEDGTEEVDEVSAKETKASAKEIDEEASEVPSEEEGSTGKKASSSKKKSKAKETQEKESE